MSAVEKFGQAHNFLSLRDEASQEYLLTDLYIELFRVNESDLYNKTLPFNGTRSVSFNWGNGISKVLTKLDSFGTNQPRILLNANDYIFFKLENCSPVSVYVHIFGVDAAGKINCISAQKSEKIYLNNEDSEEVGDVYDEISMKWPDPIPREGTVFETYVFLVISKRIDLRDL